MKNLLPVFIIGFISNLSIISSVPGNDLEIIELKKSTGAVYSLQWSPDGRYFITAGYSKTLLWNAEHKTIIRELSSLQSSVWGVAWSPDGTKIAVTSQESKIIIWHYTAGKEQQFELPKYEWAYSVAWSDDGNYLAIGTNKQQVYVYRTSDFSVNHKIEFNAVIISLAWAPGTYRIAAGLRNGHLMLWDFTGTKGPKMINLATSKRADINGLAYSPNGKLLAIALQKRAVRVISLSDDTIQKSFMGFGGWVRGISWSPDGKYLAAAGQDFTMHIWEYESGQLLLKERIPRYPIWSLEWSPDGSKILLGNGDYMDDKKQSSVFIVKVSDLNR